LLKRADRRAVIESVKKSEPLIEISLSFGRVGRDLARIGAEPIVKRFLRCTHMEAGHCQRQPDNDVQELCCGSHKYSPAHAKLFIRGVVGGNR
jgi:hypothetical protein